MLVIKSVITISKEMTKANLVDNSDDASAIYEVRQRLSYHIVSRFTYVNNFK